MMHYAIAIEIILKATLLLALAFGINLTLRRGPAAARQLLWTLALVSMLTLPLASLGLRFLHWTPAPVSNMMAPAQPVPFVDESHPPPIAPVPVPKQPAAAWPLAVVYLAGALAVAGRLIIGAVQVASLTALATPYPGPLPGSLSVDVRISNTLSLPVTWGWRRPVILLPAASLEWPPDRLRLVLAHELAHIRRRDYLGQIAAHLTCALYWFHPLVWWAKKQLVKERETACDDEVLNMGFPGTGYAEHLLAIVKSSRRHMPTPAAAIGMAEQSNLEIRVKAMLDPALNRRAPARRTTLLATLSAICVLAPLAAIQAQSTATGALSGVVRDPSGAVVPHALITATNSDAKNVEATYSGADGGYQFKGLPPGHYGLEVRARGFEVLRQRDLAVAAGAEAQFEARMAVGSLNETIEVVGQRPASTTLAGPHGTPQRIRVGGNIQASKLLNRVNPVYPANAQRNGTQGTVLLRAVIGVNGRLLELAAAGSSADPELTAAALDAVRLWTYEPTLLNGEPVEVVTTITVNFRLE